MQRLNLYRVWCVAIYLGEVAYLLEKPVDDFLILGLSDVLRSQLGKDLVGVTWDDDAGMLLCMVKHHEQALWLLASWDGVVDTLRKEMQ